MDCKNARLMLEFARPIQSELDFPETEALESHLEDCVECRDWSLDNQQFDAAVGDAMRDVEIPDGLRMRLVGHLDGQRDIFYRNLGIKVVAAAAVLIATVVGCGYWVSTWRADVDLAALQHQAIQDFTSNEFQSPEKRAVARQRDVNTWLQQVAGDHYTAPPDFDYRYLASRDVVQFQGRLVPQLTFSAPVTGGMAFATVKILGDEIWDLDAIEKQSGVGSASDGLNPVNVKALRYRDSNPRVLYLMIYRGTDHLLRPFLKRDAPM